MLCMAKPVNESSIFCAKAVRKFMVDQLQFNEEDASAVHFLRCHRLNDNRKSQKKPVIVRFKSYSDREAVWSKKSAITNREYSVSEDFPGILHTVEENCFQFSVKPESSLELKKNQYP